MSSCAWQASSTRESVQLAGEVVLTTVDAPWRGWASLCFAQVWTPFGVKEGPGIDSSHSQVPSHTHKEFVKTCEFWGIVQ